MKGGVNQRFIRALPTYQTPYALNQAAPVQNTWYNALPETNNVRLQDVAVMIATTGETIECKIIADGVTIPADDIAMAADTKHTAILTVDSSMILSVVLSSAAPIAPYRAYILEGRSVQVQVRKTTATGAGNLKALTQYAKW